MSAVIRLDIVLREAVATPYRDLVTRPTGAAVRDRVLMVLRETPDDDAHLDFSEVGLMDYSCADEVVAKLLVATRGLPRVMLHGVQQNHADAIEHALSRHDLIVVAILADTTVPRLLGAVPEDWHAVFGTLGTLGRAGAPPIASALSWPVLRAHEALEGLARRRCVVAYDDATFGLSAVA